MRFMKISRSKQSRHPHWKLFFFLLLYAAAFIFDLVTPLGYAVWLLYLPPFLLLSPLERRMAIILLSAAYLFIIVGYFFSPPGIHSAFALANRMLALVLLWMVAYLALRRMHTEEELAESQERFRAISEASFEGVVIHDGIRIIDCNQALADMLGMAVSEVIGRPMSGLVTPDSMKNIHEHSIAGTEEPYEITVIRKDGSRFFAEVRGKNATYKGSRVRGSGVFDITERKEREDMLRKSEERFRHMFESHQAVMLLVDPDNGRIVDANGAAEHFYGYSREALREMGIQEINQLPPDKVAAERTRAVLQKRSYFVFPHRVADGRIRTVEVYSSPIDVEGKFLLFSIIHDITERRQAEEALRRSEEQLRYTFSQYQMALDSSGQGTAIYYPEARQLVMDARADKLFGISGERLVTPEKVLSIIHPEDREHVKESLLSALSASSSERFELEFRIIRDRRVCWLRVTGKAFFETTPSEKKTKRLAATVLDITKQKQSEEILKRDKDTFERQVGERSRELLAAQRELDRSRRLSDIGTLAATVAHELRNPLAYIKLAGSNLRRKVRNTPFEQSIKNIEQKVDDGDKIIDDLLFYARLKSPAFEKLNLYWIFQESVDNARARFPGRKVDIDLEAEEDQELSIEVDNLQIRELFNNLINNAIEAIPAERHGKIKVVVRRDSRHIITQIQDNGSGIEQENIDRIFEPFYSTKPRGTGLGLSVVYQIIQMHKGEISVESEKSKGTIVTVTLPLEQHPDPANKNP